MNAVLAQPLLGKNAKETRTLRRDFLVATQGCQHAAVYLDEGGATLVSGCCKASHVANDTPAKRNEGGFTIQPGLQSLVPDLLQDLQRLVLLTVRKDDGLHLESSLIPKALHKAAQT